MNYRAVRGDMKVGEFARLIGIAPNTVERVELVGRASKTVKLKYEIGERFIGLHKLWIKKFYDAYKTEINNGLKEYCNEILANDPNTFRFVQSQIRTDRLS